MKKNSKFILSFLIALIAVTAFTGCSDNKNNNEGNEASQTQGQTNVISIGKGETVFLFEVTDDNNKVSAWNVSTDEKTVGTALLKVGLISGDESSNGLYVKIVNGVTADYNINKSYWAFYVNNEYAVMGIDSTNIESGKTYALIYTKD